MNEREYGHNLEQPGLIVLFGSGETSASGRSVYDYLFKLLPKPIRIAILETPAGFQPNSAQVARKVGDFLLHHLQNYQPIISIVPARKKGTNYSPDDEVIVSPLRQARLIFLGPGSPTYTVHQLQDSLAWYTIIARHRQGAALVLASAAVVAAGNQSLPVYEIYKVGDELHWSPGLDLFGPYGLPLIFVSHWNNREGGTELDTSRCYMGQARFRQLLTMLPAGTKIVGIDEHTALIIDMVNRKCSVMGQGTITLLHQTETMIFTSGQSFNIEEMGTFHEIDPKYGIPSDVWNNTFAVQTEKNEVITAEIPPAVLALIRTRESARARNDWENADSLRQQILALGWQVNDSQDDPQIIPLMPPC